MAGRASLVTTVVPDTMEVDVECNYSARVVSFVKALHPIMPMLVYSKEDIFASYCINEFISKQCFSLAEYRGLLDLFYMARTRLAYRQLQSKTRKEDTGTSLGIAWGFITSTISSAIDKIAGPDEPSSEEKDVVAYVRAIVTEGLGVTSWEAALSRIVDQYLGETAKRQLRPKEQSASPSTSSVKLAATTASSKALDTHIDVEKGGKKSRNSSNGQASPFKKRVSHALNYCDYHKYWHGSGLLLFNYAKPADKSELDLLWETQQERLRSLAKKLLTIEKGKGVAAGHVAYAKVLDTSLPIRAKEPYIAQNMEAWYSLAKQQINGRLLVQGRHYGDGDNVQPNVDPTWQWYYNPDTGYLMCPKLVMDQILLVMEEFRLYGIQEQLSTCVLEMELIRMRHWYEHGRPEDEMHIDTLPLRFGRIEAADIRYQALLEQYELIYKAKEAGQARVDHLYDIVYAESQVDVDSRKKEAALSIAKYYASLPPGNVGAAPSGLENEAEPSAPFDEANGTDNDDGEDDEEAEDGGGDVADNDKEAPSASPPVAALPHYLKPAIVCISDLMGNKPVSSFEYLVLSRALNFFAYHDTARTLRDLELTRQMPDPYVAVRLDLMNTLANGRTGMSITSELTEARDVSYHARYFPHLFYSLLRCFAMPYLDISLVSNRMTHGVAPTAAGVTSPKPQYTTFMDISGQVIDKSPNPLIPSLAPFKSVTAAVPADSEKTHTIPQMIQDYKEEIKVKLASVYGPAGHLLVLPTRYCTKKKGNIMKVKFEALVFPPISDNKPRPDLAAARKEDDVTGEWRVYTC